MYYLLNAINHGKNHRLVLTTHSPYLLYALNNCMLRWLAKDDITKAGVITDCVPVNPSDIGVWQIRDGEMDNRLNNENYTIQTNRGLIGANYFDGVMRNVMTEYRSMLQFYDVN